MREDKRALDHIPIERTANAGRRDKTVPLSRKTAELCSGLIASTTVYKSLYIADSDSSRLTYVERRKKPGV